MKEHTEHKHTSEDIKYWAMPDPDVMNYIEQEAALMIVSAKKVAVANKVDQRQALWLVATLYQNFYK